MTDEEAEEIIGYIDLDGNGKIDYEEFLEMMTKCIEDSRYD